MLARQVLNPPQRSLGLLDLSLERNAYGRQIDSAIVTAETDLPGGPLEMVFIRAPRILETGPGVRVLARRDGFPVLVLQGRAMAATFHPELAADRRVHRLFVQTVNAARSTQGGNCSSSPAFAPNVEPAGENHPSSSILDASKSK